MKQMDKQWGCNVKTQYVYKRIFIKKGKSFGSSQIVPVTALTFIYSNIKKD